jgi:hypothetical protein
MSEEEVPLAQSLNTEPEPYFTGLARENPRTIGRA